MSKNKNIMMGDGVSDRAFWDPVAQAQQHVSQMTAGYGKPRRSLEAEERFDELRKKREELIGKEQESLFRSLPEALRKEVLHRIAAYELQLHPETFSSPEIDKINQEYYNLKDMIYGNGFPDHHEYPEHPYPALMGIRYKRLCELDLECTIDKAVT